MPLRNRQGLRLWESKRSDTACVAKLHEAHVAPRLNNIQPCKMRRVISFAFIRKNQEPSVVFDQKTASGSVIKIVIVLSFPGANTTAVCLESEYQSNVMNTESAKLENLLVTGGRL